MSTTVVNLRKAPFDVKIGRNRKGEVPEVPADGCFGNPFKVEEFGREGSIAMFKNYFYRRIETDEAFRQAVLSLRGKRLGCFCKPLACHGDVYCEWLNSLPDDNVTDTK